MPQGQTMCVCASVCVWLGAVCMWELWESICLLHEGGGEMKTSAVNQTCSHLKYTRQAAWSFVVMPVHGGESTLEGKDCAHAHDTNSAFNVISDSGMHACITKTGLWSREMN